MINRVVSDKAKIAALLVLAFILAESNVRRAIHCRQITGCMDRYWANFWLISYSDGYIRRGLLGQVLRTLFGDSMSYLVLNAIAVACVLFVLALVYFLFFSRISSNRLWAIIFVVVVSGPATTVFFEVLGDPLHVAFACVLAYLLIIRKIASPVLSGILTLATTSLVILIHEGSVFLFLPFIYLIYSLSIRRKPNHRVLAVVMLVLVLGIALLLNEQGPYPTGFALVTQDSTLYYASDRTMLPLFELLKIELASYFGYLDGPARLVLKLIGAFLWPMQILLVVGNFLKAKECFRIFAYLLALSLPLYMMAHDWGRFAAYTLCLSLALYGGFAPDWNLYLPRFAGFVSEKAFRITSPLFGGYAAIIVPVLFFQSHTQYRMDGLTKLSLTLAFAALAAFALNYALNPPERQALPLAAIESQESGES